MKTTTSFEHIADIWDAKTGDKGTKMVSAVRVTSKHIVDELKPLKGKRVYEIACGNGFLARKLVGKVKEMRASDVSKKLIDFAQKKYDAKGIRYEVREATDFKAIPKNHFDAVIVHQGIFYIKDIEKLAKGISAILKKGGVVIFSEMHPLMYLANLDTYLKLSSNDLLERAKLYTKNRNVVVHKDWFVNGKKYHAVYSQFKRPFSFYINIFAKYNLLTTKIIEPPTTNMIKGKILKSSIPSSLIIKCKKT